MTFKIKVHNPWLLGIILLCSIFTPMILLGNIDYGIPILVSIASMFGCMTLAFYILSRKKKEN